MQMVLSVDRSPRGKGIYTFNIETAPLETAARSSESGNDEICIVQWNLYRFKQTIRNSYLSTSVAVPKKGPRLWYEGVCSVFPRTHYGTFSSM